MSRPEDPEEGAEEEDAMLIAEQYQEDVTEALQKEELGIDEEEDDDKAKLRKKRRGFHRTNRDKE